MAQPTVCVLNDILQSIVDAINGMTTDDYFFDYLCADLDEDFDLNTLPADDKFVVDFVINDQEPLQDKSVFSDNVHMDLWIYTLSTKNNIKTVLSKVDQDFKKLLGATHFKISCPNIRFVEREGFKRYMVPTSMDRYGFAVLSWGVHYAQDVLNTEQVA